MDTPVILYDFETLISKRGKPRRETIPIEIALFHARTPHRWFHTKIWPLPTYGTKDGLRDVLRDADVSVDSSASCIEKIGGIPLADRESSVVDVEDRILCFLRDTCGDRKPRLVAHNGKSFDHHILRHWFPRVHRRCSALDDSIDMLKAAIRGRREDLPPTLSLPVLTRPHRERIADSMSTWGMPCLKQHRALFDVVALWFVLNHHGAGDAEHAEDPVDEIIEGLSAMRMREDWEDVHGIGPKNAKALRRRWKDPKTFIGDAAEMHEDELRDVLDGLGVTRKKAVIEYFKQSL